MSHAKKERGSGGRVAIVSSSFRMTGPNGKILSIVKVSQSCCGKTIQSAQEASNKNDTKLPPSEKVVNFCLFPTKKMEGCIFVFFVCDTLLSFVNKSYRRRFEINNRNSI